MTDRDKNYLVSSVNHGLKLIEDLEGITSYKQYLEYLLSRADTYSDKEIKIIYEKTIFPNLRYGFNKEESLKIYEYYQEFEKEHPDYYDGLILNTIIVNEGDYILCNLTTFKVKSKIEADGYSWKYIYQV